MSIKLKDTIDGNISTATKLQTARTLTIGNTGKSFDGSGNVSWSLSEIGALPLTGGTLTGDISFSNISTGTKGITGQIGDNDYWRIIGGATASNSCYLEIATADDGTEPIYVRQYSSGKFVTLARTATLLDASGNTSFPGTVTAPTFSGSLSGNSSTASTLQTSRTINGTSFNGSANITTANWGTARTITIGSTGKSVNGSGNVSWSLAEIGVYSKAETDEKFKNFCPYAVGDVYVTTSTTNPATRWTGTTWQKIEGRFLLGTSGTGASKSTGGSNSKTIAQANLPNVKLTVNSFSLSRGTMEITGEYKPQSDIPAVNGSGGIATGAFYKKTSMANQITGGSGTGHTLGFQASNAWTGSTNSVSPQTSALGSGSALDVTPSYYTCHMWLRLT